MRELDGAERAALSDLDEEVRSIREGFRADYVDRDGRFGTGLQSSQVAAAFLLLLRRIERLEERLNSLTGREGQ